MNECYTIELSKKTLELAERRRYLSPELKSEKLHNRLFKEHKELSQKRTKDREAS